MPQDRRLRKAYILNYFLNRGLDPEKVDRMDADIVNYMILLQCAEKEKAKLEGMHTNFSTTVGVNI